MKPIIGIPVRFVDEEGKVRAALVTDVITTEKDGEKSTTANLAVFGWRGQRNVDGVKEDCDEFAPSTWHHLNDAVEPDEKPAKTPPQKPATPPK